MCKERFSYQMESKVTAIAQEQGVAPVARAARLAEDVKVVEGLALVAVPERGLDLVGAPPLHRDLSDGVAAETLLDEDPPSNMKFEFSGNNYVLNYINNP